MTGLPFLVVLEPLLQLPVPADPRPREPVARSLQLVGDAVVDPEHALRLDHAPEQAVDDLRVARRRHAEARAQALRVVVLVLGAERRTEEQLTGLRMRRQVVE